MALVRQIKILGAFSTTTSLGMENYGSRKVGIMPGLFMVSGGGPMLPIGGNGCAGPVGAGGGPAPRGGWLLGGGGPAEFKPAGAIG